MKLIDKMKTIFWDNEDEDDEVEEPLKRTNITKTKEEPVETVNERDLFKTETNFKFPVVFTEEDFAKTIPPEKQVNIKPKNEYNNKGQQNDKSTIKKSEMSTEIKKQEFQKKFRPSPAISPIYGVLDKNYKKEDIKTKDNGYQREEDNIMSFENVRKKAYGTLSDDIEKTLSSEQPLIKETPKKEKVTIEDVISEKKEEVENKEIEVKIDEYEEKLNPDKNITMEEAIEKYEDLGLAYNCDNNTEEDIIKIKKDKKNILEDTIEQDLFNLIDSMYDKEEGEK